MRGADVDRNTRLCFACSASLPPSKSSPTSLGISPDVFITPCCRRFICNQCTSSNPRLRRYNPCLACLGGVDVMRSRSSNNQYSNATGGHNVEGAVKDEDTFVLGDDDDDDDDSGSEDAKSTSSLSNQTPSISQATLPVYSDNNSQGGELEPTSGASDNSPLKYYIASSDTLQGIVLRFGLDGHEVCRLNKLPPSTLRTTPHLLHTRRYLILPPSARKSGIPLNNESSEQAAVREAKWGKERAERQLQTVMKEADWRVAKAYVALADDPNVLMEEQEVWERKRKEYGGNIGVGPSKLGERAIQNYLDDDEWEASQPKTRSNKGCS